MINKGDKIEFFRPDSIGVVGYGTVVNAGRKLLRVETIRGTYTINRRSVVALNGERYA